MIVHIQQKSESPLCNIELNQIDNNNLKKWT